MLKTKIMLLAVAVSFMIMGCDYTAVHIVLNNVTQPAVGKPYSYYVKAAGGSGKYDFSLSQGSLPEGLILNEDTGEIHGIISKQTDWITFTVKAVDAGAPSQNVTSDTRQIQLKAIVTPFDPDQWEPSDDGFDTTTNVMRPGDPAQYHTIDVLDDWDIIKIDLTGVAVGTTVKIETYPVTYDTDTYIYLNTNQYTGDPVGYGDNEDGTHARILYTVLKSEIHYLSIYARGTGAMLGSGLGIGEYYVDVQAQ